MSPDPLHSEPALRAFVDAVVQHLSLAPAHAGGDALEAIRRRVVSLVAMSTDAASAEDGARALAGDATVLASFFQNVDLLYAGAGYAHADALAAMVMRAVELLDSAEP